MRRRHFAMLLVLGVTAMTGESHATPLDDLRGNNRVLVVVAPAANPDAAQQRQIYRSAETGMSERSIVLIEALGESDRARQIRSRLGAEKAGFQVFLIGKDGNTAFASRTPVSAADLFGKVDAMPMRRDEMRRAR